MYLPQITTLNKIYKHKNQIIGAYRHRRMEKLNLQVMFPVLVSKQLATLCLPSHVRNAHDKCLLRHLPELV